MVNEPPSQPLTSVLAAACRDEPEARKQLWDRIYHELHGLARSQMAGEGGPRTLQTTALVHEAYMRLFGDQNIDWANRRHFFGAAARIMRRIRIDDARRRGRVKRGGGRDRVELREDHRAFDDDPSELLAINEALDKLEREDSRRAEIVMLRFFAGLSENETASAMDLSRRTVQLEWRLARAWLHRELSDGESM